MTISNGNLKDFTAYCYPLYTENFSAYIHQSFFPDRIDESSLAEFDYCMMEKTPTLKTIHGHLLKPNKKIITNSIEFIIEYAKHQQTIVYLPESHVNKDFIKLNLFSSLKTSFQIVYLHKKLNKPCSLFLDFFKQFKS